MKLEEVSNFCLRRIAGFLDLDDLGLLGAVSKSLRHFFRSDELWRDRIQTEFGDASQFAAFPGDSWLEKYQALTGEAREKIAVFEARFARADGGMDGRLNVGQDIAGCCLRAELQNLKQRIELWKTVRDILLSRDRTVSLVVQFKERREVQAVVSELAHASSYFSHFYTSRDDWSKFENDCARLAKLFEEKELSELLSLPLKATSFIYYGNYSGTHEAGVCFETERGTDEWSDMARHLPSMPAVYLGDAAPVKPGAPLDLARGQFCPKTFSHHSRMPVNVPAAHRAPALCWAAMGGHVDVCRLLLDELAVDGQAVIPAYSANALDVALANGHFQCAHFLRSHGLVRGACCNVDGCIVGIPGTAGSGESTYYGRLSCVHSQQEGENEDEDDEDDEEEEDDEEDDDYVEP